MKREARFVIYLSIIAFIYFLIVNSFLQFPKYNIPQFQDDMYVFYDDFDAPIMHMDWLWGYDFGEGSVTLSRNENRTFIEFHIYGEKYTRANFLREFPASSYARIEVVLQFVELSNDSIGLIMFRTDGGWFGVTRPEPMFTPKFVYVDDLGRKPPNIIIKPADGEWHRVTIEYENGIRKIYFDGELIEILQGPPKFTHVIIGTRDHVKNYAGVFRIDYVKVELWLSKK
jgi:hypothetical protein